MRVDAALLSDPDRLVAALIGFTRSRMWFLFWRPTGEEWAVDWFRDPASAWWES